MKNKLFKLAKMLMNFDETKVGDAVWVHEGPLAVGAEVLVEDEAGDMVPVADGEYVLEDETKITIKDGKVEEIEAKEAEEAEEEKPEVEPEKPEVEPKEEMRKPCGMEEEQPEGESVDKDAKIEELTGLLADRDSIIEELTAKIKELEDKIAEPKEEALSLNKVTAAKVDKTINGALKYFED